MFRKISKLSPNRFVVGFIVGAMLFSGSAFAYNSYVSENTPDTGYLLCANSKTKAVTFPNKLSCPAGTVALDLGAVRGLQGDDGQDGAIGANGAQGPMGLIGPMGPMGLQGIQGTAGKDAALASGYLVNMKKQDVLASVTSKVERQIISKTGFKSGYYNLIGELSVLFQNYNQQVILCSVQTTGKSYSYSAFPSHEVANTWTAHTVQFIGLVYIDLPSDKIAINCSFTGNATLNYGYLYLTPSPAPIMLDSDL